eukprot:3723538-Pyramimonas_sp.AAC.1
MLHRRCGSMCSPIFSRMASPMHRADVADASPPMHRRCIALILATRRDPPTPSPISHLGSL